MKRVQAPAGLALAAFVGLGLTSGMLGPAWPALRRDLGQPLAALGELSVLASVGYAVTSMFSARLRALLGAGPFLAAGVTASALTLALFGAAPSWPVLLAAALIGGVGAGAVDAGFNAHIALNHGPQLMNALHASFGIGATLGPLIVAVAIAEGSWRYAWAAAAVVNAAVALPLWLARSRFPTPPPEHWEAVETQVERRGLLPLMLALFFLIAGLEVSIGTWAATLLEHDGYGTGVAAAWVSVYWASFTAGRVLLAFVSGRVAPAVTVRVGALTTLAGVAILLATPAGLLIAGFGLAGLFPALVTLTPFRLGAARAPRAVGYQLTAATLGTTGVVGAAGLAAQWIGIGSLVPFFLALAIVLLALELVAARAGQPSARST